MLPAPAPCPITARKRACGLHKRLRGKGRRDASGTSAMSRAGSEEAAGAILMGSPFCCVVQAAGLLADGAVPPPPDHAGFAQD